MKVRIEIHLEKSEVKILDAVAKKERRSRKNLCEIEIKKLIEINQFVNMKTGRNNA